MQVHRCEFVAWSPAKILSLSYNFATQQIAVGRDDSSIEIWDQNPYFHVTAIIPPHSATAQSVRRVQWIGGNRLISGGWDGEIREWNFSNFHVVNSTSSFGGPIWDIAYSAKHNLIAIACEDGSVKLFDEELVLKHSFAAQSTRMLSVAFGDNVIAFGDAGGAVSVHALDTKKQLSHFTIAGAKIETQVWSLAFAGDCLATGDALGYTQFWDYQFGILRNSYATHKGPINAVCSDGTNVFSSGVDSLVVRFAKVGDGEWVPSLDVRATFHDVSALCLCNRTLVSASHDGSMGLYGLVSFGTKPAKILYPYPSHQESFVSYAEDARIFAFRFRNSVKLFKLGRSVQKMDRDAQLGTKMELQKSYKALIEIKPDTNLPIQFCELSPSGELMILGNRDGVRAYSIELFADRVSVASIELPDAISRMRAVRLRISRDYLVFAQFSGDVRVFDSGDFTPLGTISGGGHQAIALNVKETRILVAGSDRNVSIYDAKGKALAKLPKSELTITCAQFHPSKPLVLLATLSGQTYSFNYQSKEFSILQADDVRECISGFACFESKIIFWSASNVRTFLLGSEEAPVAIDRYRQLLHLSRISDSEMLVIERPWSEIIRALPMPLQKHRYGQM